MTPVSLSRYREVRKLPPSPHWSPSQGPSFWSSNSVDSLRPSPCASGSLMCLPASFSWTAPRSSLSSFQLKCCGPCLPQVHGGGHTTKTGGVISQDLQSPVEYNDGARKHRVVRGVQTSLNTTPKPTRASAYECGVTNQSTSQSTYANHRVYH
jgi:hypothetical protein